MNDFNLDAESVTRNKSYDSTHHLQHLLKVGWSPDSQLIKKFLRDNNLTENDLTNAIKKLHEIQTKECCNTL